MCTFDSPVAPCEVMHTMVLTDQTQAQCAAEHECKADTPCPLCGCFTGTQWMETPKSRPPSRRAVTRPR